MFVGIYSVNMRINVMSFEMVRALKIILSKTYLVSFVPEHHFQLLYKSEFIEIPVCLCSTLQWQRCNQRIVTLIDTICYVRRIP